MKKLLSLCVAAVLCFGLHAEEKFLHWKDTESPVMERRNPVVYSVSPNGKYAVGRDEVKGASFFWNIETDERLWLTDVSVGADETAKLGSFTDVSDNKVIAGQYPDVNYSVMQDGALTALKVAAVWDEQGNVTSFGLGDDITLSDCAFASQGTVANAISGNGLLVVGAYKAQNKFGACCWTKQQDGSWKYERLPLPEYPGVDEDGNVITIPIEGVDAVDANSEGNIIVGYFQMEHTSYPCYWTKKDDKWVVTRIQYDMGDWETLMNQKQNMATAISPNGKYMGFFFNGKGVPAVYDMEKGTYVKMEIPADGAKTADYVKVTDNGDLFYTWNYGSVFTGNYSRPMWYSAEHGMSVDLNYLVSVYAPKVKPSEDVFSFAYEKKQQLIVSCVSADGAVVGGALFHAGMPRSMESFLLCLSKQQVNIPAVPETPYGDLTGDRKVKLNWNVSENASGDFKLFSYNVYSDGKHIAVVPVEGGKTEYEYTVENENAGYIRYSIACNYRSETIDSLESPRSQVCEICVPDNFNFPLFEDFETENWTDNYWVRHNNDGASWGMRKHMGFGSSMTGSAVIMHDVPADKPHSATVETRPIDATDVTGNIMFSFATYAMLPAENKDGNKTLDSISIEVAEAFTDEWHTAYSISLEDMGFSYKFFETDITEFAAGKVFRARIKAHGQKSLQPTILFDKIAVDVEKNDAPNGVIANHVKGFGHIIAWKNSNNAYELNYLTNIYGNVFTRTVGNEGKDLIGANLFTPEYLEPYDGKYLTSIRTRINEYETEENTKDTKVAVMVWADNELILEEDVDDFTTFNRDTIIVLKKAVKIDASKSMKVGLKVYDYDAHQLPLVYLCSSQWKQGYSDIYSEDGGKTWNTLTDAYASEEDPTFGWGSWFISAQITDEATIDLDTEVNDSLVAYALYNNGEQINKELVCSWENRYIDSAPGVNNEYSVRAFYNEGGVSPLSEAFTYVTTDVPAVKDDNAAFCVFPNPTADVLNISGGFDYAVIYTIDGMKVMETTKPVTNVSNLSDGTYILEIISEDNVETHKLIKR